MKRAIQEMFPGGLVGALGVIPAIGKDKTKVQTVFLLFCHAALLEERVSRSKLTIIKINHSLVQQKHKAEHTCNLQSF